MVQAERPRAGRRTPQALPAPTRRAAAAEHDLRKAQAAVQPKRSPHRVPRGRTARHSPSPPPTHNFASIFSPDTLCLGPHGPVLGASGQPASAPASAPTMPLSLEGLTPLLGGLLSPVGADPVDLAFATGTDPQLARLLGQQLSIMA